MRNLETEAKVNMKPQIETWLINTSQIRCRGQ